MDLIGKVRKWNEEEALLARGDGVIIGLSGGADSVCLLLCLKAMAKEYELTLRAVHVHHGIRGEDAEEDAAFCRELCRQAGIAFRLYREDVPDLAARQGLSLEEAGRRVRYEIFRREARQLAGECPGGRARIAVAHHRDDQAETVLMNLCRGTGIRGLGGMPAFREGEAAVIRPLLPVRRREIEDWLRGQGQTWRKDATNTDEGYTRNRIRARLIPWLTREVNARSVEHIAEMAEQVRELDAYLQAETERWLTRHGRREKGNSSDLWRLPADKLTSLPRILEKTVLLEAAGSLAGGRKDLTSRHVNALVRLAAGPVGKKVSLPGRLTAWREYEDLVIAGEDPETVEESGQVTEKAPLPVKFNVFSRENGQKIPQNRYTKWFDCDKIRSTVGFRHRQSGDAIALAGVGRKSVKKYMIDAKIPAADRDAIWLMTDGDEIMWIVGWRMSAAYQIGPDTRRILQVTWQGQEEDNHER